MQLVYTLHPLVLGSSYSNFVIHFPSFRAQNLRLARDLRGSRVRSTRLPESHEKWPRFWNSQYRTLIILWWGIRRRRFRFTADKLQEYYSQWNWAARDHRHPGRQRGEINRSPHLRGYRLPTRTPKNKLYWRNPCPFLDRFSVVRYWHSGLWEFKNSQTFNILWWGRGFLPQRLGVQIQQKKVWKIPFDRFKPNKPRII